MSSQDHTRAVVHQKEWIFTLNSKYFIVSKLYSDQHWKYAATRAAALGWPNLNCK